MAVLWPGSALWQRETLEDEKAANYVFGKARKGSRPHEVVVAYAAEEYYKQHGTYNLKMILTNKESTKGRYYIVSGN